MENVTLVMADEIHLIGDERWPKLEIALARLPPNELENEISPLQRYY